MKSNRSLSLKLLTFLALGSISQVAHAQTVLPAGLGAMSVSQPSRDTAILSGVLLSNGGENPTVKIRWGDEDRGTAVTPSAAWDNEVTVSTNQATGAFSTTITIPDQDKVYFFRALATNAGGTVVSRSLGILLPSAPVGVADLQGRWNFDGENANDSSGKNRHGVAKKLFSITDLSSLNLWLDAADTSTITHSANAVSQWNDKSGNAYHATASSANPTTGSDTIDGKNVITLGSNNIIGNSAPSAANWQDLYIVARWDGGATFDSYDGLFTGTTQTGTANGIGIIGHSGSTNLFGTNWFDNLYINGTSSATTGVLGSMSNAFLISASANSAISVTGYRIGVDRTFTSGRDWNGVIAEVVSFNTKLSDSDRQKVEGYLSHKWGLTNNLPSSHPFKVAPPISTTTSPEYITDTPFGSGKAIDLADGHVEVLTGETEDVFDGGNSFSVSAWVKGWPKEYGGPIISKGGETPGPESIPNLTLWLDGADESSFTFTSGATIESWDNKAHPEVKMHALDSTKPTLNRPLIPKLGSIFQLSDYPPFSNQSA